MQAVSLTDVDLEDDKEVNSVSAGMSGAVLDHNGKRAYRNIELSEADGELGLDDAPINAVNSPISEAHGWANAPADALEFTIVVGRWLCKKTILDPEK